MYSAEFGIILLLFCGIFPSVLTQYKRPKIEFTTGNTITPGLAKIDENSKAVVELYNFSTAVTAGEPLMYYCTVNPADGNFQFTFEDGILSTVGANDDFNYERTTEYEIIVYGADGLKDNSGSTTVTVSINDVNEPPTLDNVPATIMFYENFPIDNGPEFRIIYTVKCSDPDTTATDNTWKTFTYHMDTVIPKRRSNPYDDVFLLEPATGILRMKKSPNHEVYDRYHFIFWCTDGAGLSSSRHGLNLDIANVNESPWFNVSSAPYFSMYHGAETYSCEIFEESPIGMQLPIPPITAYDEDFNDVLTYQLEGRDHWFFEVRSINGSAHIFVKKRIDFESRDPRLTTPFVQTSSWTITLIVSAYDKRLFRTLDTDKDGTPGYQNNDVDKASWLEVKVQVYDINDNLPECAPTYYEATIAENTPVDTSILTISCTDIDYDKQIAYTVNGSELAVKYFWVDSQNPEGILKTKGPADYEKARSVLFYVYAYQGLYPNRTWTNVTVRIHITPINDKKPVFKKQFYNFEIRYDADVGTSVGRVSASDDDTGTAALLSYHWVSKNTLFKMAAHEGIIFTLKKLETSKTYIYHAHAKDNDFPAKYSEHIGIRIDTFNPAPYMVDFVVAQPLSYFNETIIEEFEAAITSACPPCVGRVSSTRVDASDPSATVVSVYALKDATTESYANIDQPKYYLSRPEMLEIFSVNSEGQPSTAVALTTFHKFPVISVKPQAGPDMTASEWLLNTHGGRFIITLLSLIALALLLTALVYLLKWLIPLCKEINCAKCNCPKLNCDCCKRPASPPPKKIAHPDGDVNVMDFRYKDAPLVPPTVLKPTTA
ncbi:protocadherin-like wing polarity protein stan [Tubulanus polymorphus]|uniref:protocadherin-like wing polarity protein stan n=1 Tax=Tubulanus polymorphus TaxID=672921 RepID=UPI003DA61400